MKVDVYKSIVKGNKYFSVPEGTKVEEMKLPRDVDPDILSLSPFMSKIDVDPSKPRIAFDSAAILADIKRQGYAIHSTEITIELHRLS